MKNISKAQEAKAKKSLEIIMRYSEGVMTRKEWIELQKTNGAKVEQAYKNRIDFNRIKYNRMGMFEQEEYERKCNEKVPCFKLNLEDNYFHYITKAEFDYFNTLD